MSRPLRDAVLPDMATFEPTAAAYQATAGGFLDLDRDLYQKIHDDKRHELVESFILPIRSGRAWKVPAGHLCRITIPEGPQVGFAIQHMPFKCFLR